MSLHIIIDGYNLIRQSDTFSTIDRRDIQDGREALVNTLAAYKRVKGHRITIVFDGLNAPAVALNKDKRKGIEIQFSRTGEIADTVIKRMVIREREKALVVSSDRDIIDFASSQGAATISSPSFEKRIAQAAFESPRDDDIEETTGWIPTTKKKGPSRRLSKRERRSRTKIRKL